MPDGLLLLEGARAVAEGFLGDDGGLDPVADLKLLQDVGHVMLDCLLGQGELLADLLVALALGDALQNLALPLGQLGHRAARAAAPLTLSGHLDDQARGQRRGYPYLASV